MIGRTIGPYAVLAKLGEGGMGEVYSARDTKLNRDAAVKVLPELFASDADRLARFTREAQTLAALNHPGIAQIYGVLDAPPEGAPGRPPVRALVMEPWRRRARPTLATTRAPSRRWRSTPGARTRLVAANSSPLYATAGILFFWRDGALCAQAFDADRLTVSGPVVSVATDVAFDLNELAHASVSSGTLVYSTGAAAVRSARSIARATPGCSATSPSRSCPRRSRAIRSGAPGSNARRRRSRPCRIRTSSPCTNSAPTAASSLSSWSCSQGARCATFSRPGR